MSQSPPISLPPSSDFPTKVLKFMKSNAKPKMALKLMKCTKFFQHSEFPYFVVKPIQCNEDAWYLFTLDGNMHNYQGFGDVEKSTTKKLWITEEINLSQFQNLGDNLLTKIAVCDIRSLRLQTGNISFNEFKFLTSSGNVEYLLLRDTPIKFENGDPVFMDDIFKCVPSVNRFYCYNGQTPIFSSDFISKMKSIDLSNLMTIGINIISYLDFEIFSDFMDQNPHIRYELYFVENSLSPDETEKLENFVETIIDFGLDVQYPPPYITFPGQSDEQLEAMYWLTHQYHE